MSETRDERQRIVVVCFGNICRSPVAEALLRERLDPLRWQVESAGVGAVDGARASHLARAVLETETGIDVGEHRSRRLTAAMVARAAHVLTMSVEQAFEVVSWVPDAADRVRLLGSFSPDPDGVGPADPGGPAARADEIPDPMGGSVETYVDCHERIVAAVDGVAAWLERGAPVDEGPPSVASPRWRHG
jgi:protein-tyrosine phosphatase